MKLLSLSTVLLASLLAGCSQPIKEEKHFLCNIYTEDAPKSYLIPSTDAKKCRDMGGIVRYVGREL